MHRYEPSSRGRNRGHILEVFEIVIITHIALAYSILAFLNVELQRVSADDCTQRGHFGRLLR